MGLFLVRSDDDALVVGVGWVTVAIFGAFGLIGARQLFRIDPVIEIDASGLLWRRWSRERMPWSAFERASVQHFQKEKFLSFWLIDRERYASTTLLGRLAGANRSLGAGDMALTAAGTDCEFDELIDAVMEVAPQLLNPSTPS
jgi:hypothetical protein